MSRLWQLFCFGSYSCLRLLESYIYLTLLWPLSFLDSHQYTSKYYGARLKTLGSYKLSNRKTDSCEIALQKILGDDSLEIKNFKKLLKNYKFKEFDKYISLFSGLFLFGDLILLYISGEGIHIL